MIEFALLATSKAVVVTLAIIGAVLTSFSKVIAGAVAYVLSGARVQSPKAVRNKIAKILVWLGYTAMSISIFLFIVSGFIIDLF